MDCRVKPGNDKSDREDDHAHSSRQARRGARARNRLTGAGLGASTGPELAAAVDQDDRAVPGGGRHRLYRAPCRQAPFRAARPVGVRREPRRRQRRHRPAGADAIRSRRLHDLDLLRHPAGGNPSLYEKLPYAPLRDFVPVATRVRFPGMLAVHPSVPARSVSELIALAKSKPAALAYASAGVGNFSHLAMELFSQATGVKLLHVPYKGTGPASLALIGGEVQMGFNNVQTLLQTVQTGQLVALAVAEPKRLPALPDLPAVAETVAGFEMAPWVGIIAPARTPKEVIERLSKETLAIMHDPQVVKQLTEQQVTPFALGPDRFSELISKDLEKWAGVIKTAGIKGE